MLGLPYLNRVGCKIGRGENALIGDRRGQTPPGRGNVVGTAHLYVDDSAIGSGRRSASLIDADGSQVSLWYEFDEFVPSTESGADPFVLGMWQLWMKRGGSYHV